MNSENPTSGWHFERRALRILLVVGIVVGVAFLLRSILLPFVLAAIISFIVNPACNRLEKQGMSRGSASALIVAALLAAVFLPFIFLFPLLITELQELLGNLPRTLEAITNWLENFLSEYGITVTDLATSIRQQVAQNASSIAGTAANAFLAAWMGGAAFFNYLTLIFVTPAVTFYIIKDRNKIAQTIKYLIPPKNRSTVVTELKEAEAALSGFLRGQLLVSLSLAAFYAIALTLLGLNFGYGFGIFAGAISAIPLVGALIGFAVVMAVALFQFGFESEWVRLGGVAAVLLVGQLVENNFLGPKLIGTRINVHPAWMIFGVLAAGALFGIIGIVLAAPTVAVVGVAVRFIVRLYKASPAYEGTRIA